MNAIRAVLVFQTKAGPVLPANLIKTARNRIQKVFADIPVYSNGMAMQSAKEYADGLLKIPDGSTPADALNFVIEASIASNNDEQSVAIMSGWSAMLDESLCAEAFERHTRYLAHFTYGENIPVGLMPDFASAEFGRLLPDGLQGGLREHAFKNIDKYDIELYFKLPDLRQWRLELDCASSRSQALVGGLQQLNGQLDYLGLSDCLRAHPELLRPFPSCLEIELTGRAPVQPIYMPRIPGKDLDSELLDKLLSEIEAEALLNDMSLILGGAGDAMLYPDLDQYLMRMLGSKKIKQVYLETYGMLLAPQRLQALQDLPDSNKLHIIIRIGALNSSTRHTMHGNQATDDLLEIVDKIENHLNSADASGPSYYVEFLRMQQNDIELDDFMQRFKDSKIRPLVGKANRWIDDLPDQRALDLSPLVRDFCWHLARDIYLNVSGCIPLCKQDPRARRGPGYDFGKGSLRDFLKISMPAWEHSFRGQHAKISMPCLQCDEWYTFNA